MSSIGIHETKEKRYSSRLIGLLLLITVVALASGLLWSTLATRGADVANGPRAVWAAQGATHYRYTLQVGCFCIEEMRRAVIVEVQDGTLLSLTYADNGSAADAVLFERYTSVEKLFAAIDEAAAQEPARLDVDYDPVVGIPTAIDIDISELMADEELYLTISDYEALP